MIAVLAASCKDAGIASGAFHMYADAETLDVLQQKPVDRLVVRTFQWDKPTVSFGYLLDTQSVQQWAAKLNIGPLPLVKRPTGGGAVLHTTTELSFSLAWRRDSRHFPDSPRACYEEIHRRVLSALTRQNSEFVLFTKTTGSCEAPLSKKEVPVCFNEPVCNDVMQRGKKVIGGALRITRSAILYQGTIQLPGLGIDNLKAAVRGAFA